MDHKAGCNIENTYIEGMKYTYSKITFFIKNSRAASLFYAGTKKKSRGRTLPISWI